jgi:hypothetical protein
MSICCLEGKRSDSGSVESRSQSCFRILDIARTCIGSTNDGNYVSECGETAKDLDL